MDVLQLLKRWAEQEPSRCRPSTIVKDAVEVLTDNAEGWMVVCPNWFDPAESEFWGTASLQRAIQRSIVSHKLRCRLESTPEGHWHATLLDLQSGCHSLGDDQEPALAMLSAYVGYLEQVKAKEAAS